MANYVHCINLSSLERHSHESWIPSEELGRKAFLADNAGVCVQVEQNLPSCRPSARARAAQRRLSALSRVYGAFIRIMASPRKSPAVIQQQCFKATCVPARRADAQEARVATPRTFGIPRCHDWRTLGTARLICASGPRWICLHRCSCPSHRRDWCRALSMCTWHSHRSRLIFGDVRQPAITEIVQIEREREWHGPVTCPNGDNSSASGSWI